MDPDSSVAMDPRAEALRQRTKRFAVRLLKFLKTLARDPVTTEVVRQLAKSGPAVSANYHATCRSRSRREFIAKLGVVLEEADEPNIGSNCLSTLVSPPDQSSVGCTTNHVSFEPSSKRRWTPRAVTTAKLLQSEILKSLNP
jgi:four helix bundle protein